jgi:hypothetical protein
MESDHFVDRLIRDRIDEALAQARTAALLRAGAPRRRWSYALGIALIRLGHRLTRSMDRPGIELPRAYQDGVKP